MNNRGIVLWVVSVVLAGGTGYMLGVKHSPSPVISTTPAGPGNEPTTSADSPPSQDIPVFDELQQLLAAQRWFAAIDLIESRLLSSPGDTALLFQLAELQNRTQQPEAAIQTLLTLRSSSLEADVRYRARQKIDQIILQADARFVAANQIDRALSFYQDLLVLDPGYDRHRVNMTRWLIRNGDLETADRLLRETGLNGVSQAELAQAKADLALRRETLPVRRHGGALLTDISVMTKADSAELTMVLDTGATLTAVNLLRLRELGAERTPHSVQAQTANGTVELPIYRLDSVQVGALTLRRVPIAALLEPLAFGDGLLGLDILDQLPQPLNMEPTNQ